MSWYFIEDFDSAFGTKVTFYLRYSMRAVEIKSNTCRTGTSLAAQWLRLCSLCRDMGSTCDWGAKTHVLHSMAKNKQT